MSLDDIFNEQWHDKIADVIQASLPFCSKLNISPEDLIIQIVDYNINKTMDNVLETEFKALPKQLNWQNEDCVGAFEKFKHIVDTCINYPKFKKTSFTLNVTNNLSIIDELNLLVKIVNEQYPEISVHLRKMTTKNLYKLILKKSIW